MSTKLTAKQEKFCTEYMVDLNACQAAIRAGYSKHTAKDIGCENLAKPNISEKITELRAIQSKRTEITADYVLNGIRSVAERCMQNEAALDEDGKPIGEYKFEHSGANKSFELLGRHLKLFTDKTEHNIEGVAFNMNFAGKDKK